MRRVTFYAMQVGDHWEVACSQRGIEPQRHEDRARALAAAQEGAQGLWARERIATAVVVSEDDGGWHQAATYGDLLDF
ncbi:hypothetical protein [Agrilutibacter solisilvae]|uniref:Uncharacterized protein n=1 Tax=Agrilutibacter solisilvae TaxID=2763317 RepID=A0A974Y0J5_9GAMM|nr:hypothetical protein [Lysobacter solisilvae]QSX79048.1 hypothetical protein I8J32_003840 [Lysobacter solisilvae]